MKPNKARVTFRPCDTLSIVNGKDPLQAKKPLQEVSSHWNLSKKTTGILHQKQSKARREEPKSDPVSISDINFVLRKNRVTIKPQSNEQSKQPDVSPVKTKHSRVQSLEQDSR